MNNAFIYTLTAVAPLEIALIALAGLVLLGIGVLIGFITRKKIAEKKIGSAEAQAEIIVDNAKKEAFSFFIS